MKVAIVLRISEQYLFNFNDALNLHNHIFMAGKWSNNDRNGKLTSIPGLLVIGTLILGMATGTPLAFAQEVSPTVKNMALITTQFDDPLHNKYLFDSEKAVSSFKAFYDLNSHGEIVWNVTMTPTWYTLPKPFKYYDVTCKLDRGDYFAATYDFITDALRAASKDIDLTKFDYVMIVYPRYDSTLDHSCTFPSHSWIVDDREYHFGLSIVRESASYSWLNDNLWVMVREANRFLGLPYLYGPSEGQVPAAWDVMGWNEGNHNSTLIGGWSKTRLGWIEDSNVKVIGYGGQETVTLEALGNKPSKFSLIKLPVTSEHYFLIEARLKVGGDAGLPPDVQPGVVITEVDESSDTSVVKWIGNPASGATAIASEIQDIAFVSGDRFSSDIVGSVDIVSKTQNSYVVEVDRSFLYPRTIEGRYDYNGIQYVLPEGWKSKVIGWDVFAAKNNPLITSAKLNGMAMSVRIIDPTSVLEDYSSNPLFSKVECRPTYQRYLEVNSLVAKEVTLRCSSPPESSEFLAPVAVTYYFGHPKLEQGSTTYEDRLVAFTLAADSPGILDAYLPEFEEVVSTVQIRDSKDVRTIEKEAVGLREQIQKITLANSVIEVHLSTNSVASNFTFDPDEHTIAFKVNAMDSNGKTRIPYDTFLTGPYWVRVDGQTSTSFLILEDEVSGQRFIQLSHHPGVNDIQITGISSVVPTPAPISVESGQPLPPENERPVEIILREPLPEQSIRQPSVLWKWAELVMYMI